MRSTIIWIRRFAAATVAALVCSIAIPAPVRDNPAAKRKEIESYWADLEKEDAVATRALLLLSARPVETVAFLKEAMKPLRIEPEAVKALLTKLGSDKDDVWKPAFEELEYFDPRLAIDLSTLMNDVTDSPARERMVAVLSGRTADMLAGKTVTIRPVGNGEGFNFFDGRGSWWAEHRVEKLNGEGWGNPKKKWTRAVRAIILLEHFGNPDAVAILTTMAGGHADAQPSKEAKAALARIAEKNR
jgi:hypothetical protein